MGNLLDRLLKTRKNATVSWTARDRFGVEVVRIDIVDEGDGRYSVAAAIGDIEEMEYRQRHFTLAPEEDLNNIGLLVRAIVHLEGEI